MPRSSKQSTAKAESALLTAEGRCAVAQVKYSFVLGARIRQTKLGQQMPRCRRRLACGQCSRESALAHANETDIATWRRPCMRACLMCSRCMSCDGRAQLRRAIAAPTTLPGLCCSSAQAAQRVVHAFGISAPESLRAAQLVQKHRGGASSPACTNSAASPCAGHSMRSIASEAAKACWEVSRAKSGRS